MALAERLGVEPSTVSRWEKGQTMPHQGHFEEICRTLGRPAEFFLVADDNRMDSFRDAVIQELVSLEPKRGPESLHTDALAHFMAEKARLLLEVEKLRAELAARPVLDPLAERVMRLPSEARQYVEDLVSGLEDSPPSPDPEQGRTNHRKQASKKSTDF